MTEEVDKVLRGMKNGKSQGEDGLSAELFKWGGEKMKEKLAKLFSMCLRKREIPSNWNNAIILLYTKGDKERVENYRPISLLSVLYKMFTKVILNRIERDLDFNQRREQAGSHRGFSTMDHIQALNEVMERTNEYELPLCLGSIDFEKAFDSVSLAAVLNSLEHQGIESAYIKLLRNTYSTATSVVRLHQDSEKFKVGKGVRQGDSISPKLFSAVLEGVFQNLNWDEVGIKINGDYLNHLRFVDDIVLFASSAEELQTRMEELCNESAKIRT